MRIDKLILTYFKNYEFQTLQCCERLNCFVGLNGMGKTNLLDAIYYLCMCKSSFQILDNDIVHKGQDFFRLESVFLKDGKKEKVVAKFQPKKKKVFERNDIPYPTLSEHIGFLPVVMIAPGDTNLATEGSEERRRFMDTTLSQMDSQYLQHLLKYNKILEQRNAYLKKASDVPSFSVNDMNAADQYLLDVYDKQLQEPAAYIFDKRTAFAELFTPSFNQLYKSISDEAETVEFTYQSSLSTHSYEELLLKNRTKDMLLHRTTAGVHRDDLVFSMNGSALKKFGSQGQLKSFVLSLKLTQYEILHQTKQVKPILLLDDIFDKLDAQRLKNLLFLLARPNYGQIFITDTHQERLEEIVKGMNIVHSFFEITNGMIATTHHT